MKLIAIYHDMRDLLLLLSLFLPSTSLHAAPVSTDPTSVTRLAILTGLDGPDSDFTTDFSFSTVFPTQVSQINKITGALNLAITPNAAVSPNPPINLFTPALLNDKSCGTPGDCFLNNVFSPLAFTLYKLTAEQVSTAQYSALIAALLYFGANPNLALGQLSAQFGSSNPITANFLATNLVPPLLANFIFANSVPATTGTYQYNLLDPDSGILIKTPDGTPAGTVSQFCQDLVTANLLAFADTASLTADNIWLGGICTADRHCCGNNVCNTSSGANLGQTPSGVNYGYCDLPDCVGLGKQPASPTGCCAGLAYSAILDLCLTPAGAPCEPPTDPGELSPCLVGYTCDGGYCMPQSGVICLAKAPVLNGPVCANNLSCDPTSNYCCKILGDSCTDSSDCCNIFECDIPNGAPAGTLGTCKYAVHETCTAGECVAPYICGTSGDGLDNTCCGQMGASCGDKAAQGGDDYCCSGWVCNEGNIAGVPISTCVPQGFPLGANCQNHETSCNPGLICDPCTYRCVANDCESCPSIGASCTDQSQCCKVDCYNETCDDTTCFDATCNPLTCAWKNAEGKEDSSCMATGTCSGTCEFIGGFGSTCYGSYSDNPMCGPTDASGLIINDVVCGNITNQSGAAVGVCCLPTSPIACVTDPTADGCMPGCTYDSDCCDSAIYTSAAAIYDPSSAHGSPGLAKCSSGLCIIDCLIQGAYCGPSATGNTTLYNEDTAACTNIDPASKLQVTCGQPDQNEELPGHNPSLNYIYLVKAGLGATVNAPDDCDSGTWRIDTSQNVQCCVLPNFSVCQDADNKACSDSSECTSPATCTPNIPTQGICCAPSDTTCGKTSDCCDDSLQCIDNVCAVPESPVTEDIEIFVPTGLVIAGLLTIGGKILLLWRAQNRITAIGKAFGFSDKDIKRIRDVYVDGIFALSANNDPTVVAARKTFADAIATAIYNAADQNGTLSAFHGVYGTGDRVQFLLDAISNHIQLLIAQQTGMTEGMEGIIGALNSDAIFGNVRGDTALRLLGRGMYRTGLLGTFLGELAEGGGRRAVTWVIAKARQLKQKIASWIESAAQNSDAADIDAATVDVIGKTFGLLAQLPRDPVTNASFVAAANDARVAAETIASKLAPAQYPGPKPANTNPVVSTATDDLVTNAAASVSGGPNSYGNLDACFNAQPQKMAKLYFDLMAVRLAASPPRPVDDESMANAMGDLLGGKVRNGGLPTNKYNLADSFTNLFATNAATIGANSTVFGQSKLTSMVTIFKTVMSSSAKRAIMFLAYGEVYTDADIADLEAAKDGGVSEIGLAIQKAYNYLGDIEIEYPNGVASSIFDAPPTGYTMPDLFSGFPPDDVALNANAMPAPAKPAPAVATTPAAPKLSPATPSPAKPVPVVSKLPAKPASKTKAAHPVAAKNQPA